MRVTFVLTFIAVCALLLTGITAKRWSPVDSRCSGSSYRLKRGATSNNSGYYWKFNGNSGTCERQYGNPQRDYGAFDSKSECDRECRNVYHF